MAAHGPVCVPSVPETVSHFGGWVGGWQGGGVRVGALGVGGGVGVAFHGSGDVIALIKWGGWQWAVSAHPRCPLLLHPSNPHPPPPAGRVSRMRACDWMFTWRACGYVTPGRWEKLR